MSEAALIQRAEELLAAQYERVSALLPAGCAVFDAHTHLGLDEDGHALSVAGHLRLMDEAGVRAANVFALNEPDREPAYRAPNDRVLEWAADVPDRLFPFVRLSLDEDPLGEAVRCLDRGARGIKLHPRAQAFRVNDPQLEAVFALADERRLPVLIHAGRGLPPGMPLELGHVAERHPGASLILAHAAIVAQAGIGELARSVENIFFDSSTWSPYDLLNLLSLVPPEQVLWASDIPYGEPLGGTSESRLSRSYGDHVELSKKMFSTLRASSPMPACATIAACARISDAPGCRSATCPSSRGIPEAARDRHG